MHIPDKDVPPPARSGTAAPRPNWEIVFLLWGAFFLNQADRQVFNVVLPLIRADLHLSDSAMGLIATVFTVVYGLLVPFAGLAGDILNRRSVIIASLVIFSVGTLLTGFASSFLLLLVFRGVATGAGEAMYAPSASALIGETHVKTRARALAIHQTANYTGVVLGSLFTGWVAQSFGWRAAFLTYGIAGLVWASVISWRTRRLPRPTAATARASVDWSQHWRQMGESLAYIRTRPILLAQMVAFGGLVFSMVGFLTWMPTLLFERFGLSLVDAGFSAVFYHHILAYVGVLGASTLTDRLIVRFPRIRLISMSLGLMTCAPFILLSASASQLWVVYAGFAGFGFFRGVYDASLFAAVLDAVEDRLRSTVLGLLIASGFLIGAASPLLMGLLKRTYGLEAGLVMIAAVGFTTGLILLVTALLTRHPTLSQPEGVEARA